MFKRSLIGGGALVAAYLVGSLTLGGALAQTNPSPSSQPAAPAATEAGKQYEAANEANDAAALASQAKVTANQAKAAALARFPGATVGQVELDDEDGVVVYSVELTDSTGKGQDVKVDATSGTVLQVQADGPENHGGAEGPEKD
jgi:uncharacterized membrane protein YkoI